MSDSPTISRAHLRVLINQLSDEEYLALTGDSPTGTDDRRRLVPRMLRDVAVRDLVAKAFGRATDILRSRRGDLILGPDSLDQHWR